MQDGEQPGSEHEADALASFGYFWSLTVEDVRCFGPVQTLELHAAGELAKWTVILGDNGVGKTTLLQCLVAMNPTDEPRMEAGLAPTTRGLGWREWPGGASRSVYDALARRGNEPTLTARVARGSEIGSRPRRNLFWSKSSWKPRESGSSTNHIAPFELFCCAYGASRKPGASALAHESDDSLANAITLFNEQATLLGAEEWFLQSDYAAASTRSPDAIARSNRIRQTLIDLLPDVEDLRVVGLDRHAPRPALEACTPYGWVRLRDLSLGYRTLMAWVIDFAARMFARYPDSADPLAEPAVCLVDEIDLHLHPTWQRRLIEFLDKRFPNTQFIVTAHSPLVVQAVGQVNIAVLRRHEGEDFVTIHNDLDAIRGWRVDQILTSDLFGLEGSRAPQVNQRLQERAEILRKPDLDEEDRERLASLDAELASLPHGDTPEDRRAWDLVRRFAESLGKQVGG